ncbi:MAG: helix-turn-helix domain-containing protein [Planctomycetota bacterium]
MANQFDEAFSHLAQFIALMSDQGGASSGSGWPPVMGIKRCCEYLDIGETKFRELIGAGEIPEPFGLGGRHHWHREDLDRYIRKQTRRR